MIISFDFLKKAFHKLLEGNMPEEIIQVAQKQKGHKRIDFVTIILMLVMVGIIVVMAMQFLAPTIGTCFVEVDGGCPACLCSIPVDCGISADLPKGELVVIIPKTLFVGKPNKMIAFAYSPAKYSKKEIDELTRQYLQNLKLQEDNAHIEKLAVFMDIEGYPRIPNSFDICDCSFTGYVNGDTLFIDPDGLTVWHLAYTPSSSEQIIGVSGSPSLRGCSPPSPKTIIIEFTHPNPKFNCPRMCPYENGFSSLDCCRTYLDGSVVAEVQIKPTIRSRLEAAWTNIYPLRFLFVPPLLALIVYLVKEFLKTRNKNTPK